MAEVGLQNRFDSLFNSLANIKTPQLHIGELYFILPDVSENKGSGPEQKRKAAQAAGSPNESKRVKSTKDSPSSKQTKKPKTVVEEETEEESNSEHSSDHEENGEESAMEAEGAVVENGANEEPEANQCEASKSLNYYLLINN